SSARHPARGKVLLCNNTAIRARRLIKRARRRARLAGPGIRPILAAMSETDDLARRFFALWAEYLTALVAEPKMAEPLRRWLAASCAAAPQDLLPGLKPIAVIRSAAPRRTPRCAGSAARRGCSILATAGKLRRS